MMMLVIILLYVTSSIALGADIRTCSAFGDPHVNTFDGEEKILNKPGKYVLIENATGNNKVTLTITAITSGKSVISDVEVHMVDSRKTTIAGVMDVYDGRDIQVKVKDTNNVLITLDAEFKGTLLPTGICGHLQPIYRSMQGMQLTQARTGLADVSGLLELTFVMDFNNSLLDMNDPMSKQLEEEILTNLGSDVFHSERLDVNNSKVVSFRNGSVIAVMALNFFPAHDNSSNPTANLLKHALGDLQWAQTSAVARGRDFKIGHLIVKPHQGVHLYDPSEYTHECIDGFTTDHCEKLVTTTTPKS